ncbi:hypothetical protein DFH09DRAFT_405073 [Mycena vulgaris]|nr:hypothetical protein DFH09DRAFT_405073 [Mycena vulgaris]
MMPLLILATYGHEYSRHLMPLPGTSLAQLNAFLVKNAGHSADAIGTRASTRPRVCPSAQDAIFHQVRLVRSPTRTCMNICAPRKRILQHSLTIVQILDGQLGSQVLRLSLTRRRRTLAHYPHLHSGETMPRRECARCQTVVYCCKEGGLAG